ncbi:Uncharacterised protein [Mycobacterium tuberculosis]|uniref:Uncharacterized protein n=2 Tax=Mycobacterium tuberculosis TaxID=1773 RepID=A0A655FGW3_MYCTX|nr:Uncharacterised protein [Mycobacterium tuberculosis]CFE49201.1 Uncharacterised protein [Mycobacterium tuberculosis]CFR64731.1 Uncharacterised protein [Mycobacterium tuberculosis]CKO02693.1 Uncharacterised protein [Mycobacterium tuberculosis]CKQ85292.1 Uncharacterised protein [Mycobacterium tuberculosis]
MDMARLTWARTSPSLLAIRLAPPASLSMSPVCTAICLEPSSSLLPTSPACQDVRACSSDRPAGRVMPLTIATPGTWLTRCTICSRSARAFGVRRSVEDWMNRYSGMIRLDGKCLSNAAYPIELSTEAGSVLRSS